MPDVRTWSEFTTFFSRLQKLGVVTSIKDLYWDIRPKPEFGTVEIRAPDTPLEVGAAADLAAYVQVLMEWTKRLDIPVWLDDYVYRHNRVQAARWGYDGRVIIGALGERQTIYDHLRFTLDGVAKTAAQLNCETAIARLAEKVASGRNDASWQRNHFQSEAALPQLVGLACDRWNDSVS